MIHFSLRVPDSSQTNTGGVEGRVEVVLVVEVVELVVVVWGLRCHWGFRWQDLSWGRQRATRASVPSNVLENSLTPRSVALHLPIVASPGSSPNRDAFERERERERERFSRPPSRNAGNLCTNLKRSYDKVFNLAVLWLSTEPVCSFSSRAVTQITVTSDQLTMMLFNLPSAPTHTHTHTHTHLFPKTRVKPLQGTALFLCLPF